MESNKTKDKIANMTLLGWKLNGKLLFKVGTFCSLSFCSLMFTFSLVLKIEGFQFVFPSVLEGNGKESKPFPPLQFSTILYIDAYSNLI